MANPIQDIIDDALRQGWRMTQGAKHKKLWRPDGRMFVPVSHDLTTGGHRGLHNFIRSMKHAGYNPSEEKPREKPMASVQDLIKANGAGEPITEVKPADPPPRTVGGKRVQMKGLDAHLLTILKAVHPADMDFTTIKMKAAMNYPGVAQPTLNVYLNKLIMAGVVQRTRLGYYRATSADATLPNAPVVAAKPPAEPLVPVVPGEVKVVIDQLITAVDAAERLIVRLSRQLAEQAEAAETIKRLASKL